jgi:hypothetical protein
MRRRAKTVSLVLVLTVGLATAARSEQVFKPNDREREAALQAVLHNEWIEKLPYVTDLQPGQVVSGYGSKNERVFDYEIVVMTDSEDHLALLEKQVPGSLEGFRVIVLVDRSKEWDIKREQMMAKAQRVIDDPANKWILKIPHVIRMLPSSVDTIYREPKTPAVGIAVDSGKYIKEVQSKVPKTIGGYPTRYGWVEGFGECFTNNGKGCNYGEDDGSGGD